MNLFSKGNFDKVFTGCLLSIYFMHFVFYILKLYVIFFPTFDFVGWGVFKKLLGPELLLIRLYESH